MVWLCFLGALMRLSSAARMGIKLIQGLHTAADLLLQLRIELRHFSVGILLGLLLCIAELLRSSCPALLVDLDAFVKR